MGIKIILTGATGLVGEGVLFECLENNQVDEVLMVNRKPYQGNKHPKLRECLVPDFFTLDTIADQLIGYHASFYCAGISSNGMSEEQYTPVTYDTALAFATKILALNPDITFCHISGSHTDSTEKGRFMWARVKGKTENALMRMPFKNVYNFRPGFMKPTKGQQNIKGYYKVISALSPVLKLLFPMLHMKQVGQAMINSVTKGYDKQVLEIKDIKALAAK
jgi:uncharacterized protein YbjT (DUF2867 family)